MLHANGFSRILCNELDFLLFECIGMISDGGSGRLNERSRSRALFSSCTEALDVLGDLNRQLLTYMEE